MGLTITVKQANILDEPDFDRLLARISCTGANKHDVSQFQVGALTNERSGHEVKRIPVSKENKGKHFTRKPRSTRSSANSGQEPFQSMRN